MLSSEEKLQRFSESVYQDAQNQCNALIEEAKKKASAETDIFETECLEAAYKTIKKQMSVILRLSLIHILKTLSESQHLSFPRHRPRRS